MVGLQFFDPRQDFTVTWKTLPHWSQAETMCFITWRTADSLPAAALKQLAAERSALFAQFGVQADENQATDVLGYRSQVSPKLDHPSRVSPRLTMQLEKLPPLERAKLHWQLFTAWDAQLDRGAGECLLAQPELSAIVETSLRHFDGDRYVLTDAVVMPNHVHVLAAFANEDQLLAQATSWKRYTARKIQCARGRRGEFWQVEQFDHLVRSLEQFAFLRRYVAENPQRARLRAESYRLYSKAL
jgi:REP element-mobilizing transposase RayT